MQEALAGLVADRAVDGMPQQQLLFDHRPGLLHFLAVGDDHGSVGYGGAACGNELREHRYVARLGVSRAELHQAHAAAANHRQTGVPAVVRYLDAGPPGRLNPVDAPAVWKLDFVLVDDCGGHVRSGVGVRGFSPSHAQGSVGPVRWVISFQSSRWMHRLHARRSVDSGPMDPSSS